MELLRAQDLGYSLAERDLLTGVTLTLRAGMRLGVVGKNGAGKTTLLRLLAGELEPSAGRVLRGPGLRLAYLEQGAGLGGCGALSVGEVAEGALAGVRQLERDLRDAERALTADPETLARYAELSARFEAAGGYEAEARLGATLERLGFGAATWAQPADSLSGGERARLALALALMAQPEVLLLDEPTSHLDLLRRRWLGEVLGSYPGALVFVSHDRALLDAAATHTAHLDGGRLDVVRGGYSRFRAAQSAQQRAQAKLEREAAKEARRREAAQARLGRSGAKQRETLSARRPLETKASGLELKPARARGALLAAKRLRRAEGERTILDGVQLRLGAGEKVALLGPNGSGKSTLLELLAQASASDDPEGEVWLAPDARLAYQDQTRRGLGDTPILGQLTTYVSEARARLLLALVGLPAETWQRPPETLSGGERARAALALLIAGEKNLLLLDEPEADLDVAMLETLQATLADTPAAVVLATHDAALAAGVAERVWTLEGGKLLEVRGGVEGYFRGTLRLEPDLSALDPLEPESVPPPDPEGELERLEDEVRALELALLDPLRLSERERERARSRLKALVEELSLRYDARLPPAAPRYGVLEPGLAVAAEDADGGLALVLPEGLALSVLIQDGVGHLRLRVREGLCLLPWAQTALLRAAVRLAFYHLGVRAVQTQSRDDLRGTLLGDAGAGWWTLSRKAFERLEGHQPVARGL